MASAAPDYVYVDFAAPGQLGKAATETLITSFLGAVDEFKIVGMPVQIAAGDDVVTELLEHMTWKGKPVVLHAVDIKRFAGGQVVAEWQYSNYVEVLAQIFGVTFAGAAP
jgi:hypothetical protein